MKVLGWYTVVFSVALILMMVATSAGIVDKPPFTWFETLIWAVFMLPIIILGWVVAKGSGGK